eukprot:358760-Chlamydomonas_euryale.AAC.8
MSADGIHSLYFCTPAAVCPVMQLSTATQQPLRLTCSSWLIAEHSTLIASCCALSRLAGPCKGDELRKGDRAKDRAKDCAKEMKGACHQPLFRAQGKLQCLS